MALRRPQRLERESLRSASSAAELKRAAINIDDNFFGVTALSADGAECLVTFATGTPRK